MRADLVHLHAAIRILAPAEAMALIPTKIVPRKTCAWFGKGELGRLLLEVLRDAQMPMTSGQLARGIIDRRGLDPNDRVVARRVEGMVGPALRRREGTLVEAVMNGSRVAAWRLIRS